MMTGDVVAEFVGPDIITWIAFAGVAIFVLYLALKKMGMV